MTPIEFTGTRLFHYCAGCGLKRLCFHYGRRWLCDECAEQEDLL